MSKLYKKKTRLMFHANIKVKIPANYDDDIFNELYGVLEEVDKKL